MANHRPGNTPSRWQWGTSLMRAVPYKSALQGVPAPYQYSFYSLYPPYASQPAIASAQMIPTRPATPRLPAESTEDAPSYMISSNHGLTAHVGYWNSRPLLQLRAWARDRNGAPRTILVMLELAELDAMEWDIGWAEALLNEHNNRTHAGPAGLLFRQLSIPDSEQLRHLEVSHWQGYVRASLRRFFINPQGDLYPTKDGIQYNADQLAILRWLFPLIRRDFAKAAGTPIRWVPVNRRPWTASWPMNASCKRKKLASAPLGLKAGMRSIAMPLGPPPPGTDMLRPHHQRPPSLSPPLVVVVRTSSPSRLWPLRKEDLCPS